MNDIQTINKEELLNTMEQDLSLKQYMEGVLDEITNNI